MSRIRTNLITNRMANGAPTVSHGLVVAGVTTVTGSINNLNLTGITTSVQHQATNVNVTGVVTATTFSGSGASLTNLNGSNIASGTVPVARIGTGTKSTSTFYRGDGTFATVTSTTINNNATTKFITGTNNANELDCEANLSYNNSTVTFSSSNFLVDKGTNPTISAKETAGNKEVQLRANTTGGLLRTAGSYPLALGTNQTERVRIETDGSCYFGPQIITEADMNWGHDAHQRPYVFSGNQSGVNPADATIVVANPNTDPPSTRLGSFMFGCKTSSGGNSGIKAYIEGWTTSNPSNTYEAGGYIKFVTRQSAGSLTEHFKIDHDGKLYKSGNHFYPLVNYTEVATFSAASVSSSSYTDLRTIYSSYTPKKANNLIVIHHQSQCWQGGHANSNGDAMWKIQRQEGGGSWTDVTENDRIMGNMDGRNYTGQSGLARHHRTVHLMGSFTCNGSSFNLKSLGKVDFTSVGLQWYHHSFNILQVWEYEKG